MPEIAKNVVFENGRLSINGEPFPYALCVEHGVTLGQEETVIRDGFVHAGPRVLTISLLIDGPVTVVSSPTDCFDIHG